MNKYKKKDFILIGVVSLTAFVIFIWIYGVSILNPSYTDWIMNGGDLTQHYLGAEAFRKSRWFFPIGMMDNLTYPVKTCIMFTDSLPIIAILYKLLSPILPMPFQYAGWWGLLCLILQGNIAARILKKYTGDSLISALGSVLYMMSPIMIHRIYGHEALGGQWLILLSGYLLAFYTERYCQNGPAIRLAIILGVITPLIHMYFFAECGVIILCYGIYDWLKQKKAIKPLAVIAVYIVAAVATIALLGGFDGTSTSAEGLGLYSFNLNGFVNSQNYSTIIPGLPSQAGQYEGFAYFGISMIALIIIGFVDLYIRRRRGDSIDNQLIITCVVLAVVCLIISLSNRITIGDKTIVTVPIPGWLHKMWSIFRATGRLIWPLYYLLMLLGIVGSVRRVGNRRWAVVLLVVCIAFQVFELAPLYGSRNKDGQVYDSGMNVKKWEEIVDQINADHFVTIGGSVVDEGYFALTHFAIMHDLTINRFYTARGSSDDVANQYTSQAIRSGIDGNLYIFLDQIERINFPELNYYLLDGMVIGVKEGIILDLPRMDDAIRIPFDGINMNNAENIEGKRYLYENGSSYGPYTFLEAGRYQVVIEGVGLSKCTFDVFSNTDYSDAKLNIIAYSVDSVDDKHAVLVFELSQALPDVEFRVFNHTSETVVLHSIDLIGPYE